MRRIYTPRFSPWHIDEADFYELETFEQEMRFLLRYAILAPSSHNSQPWSFRITADGVEVLADPERRLPVADPGDRELVMSLGAAITNFRVAAAHFGFETSVFYETRPEESLPVATVFVRETCLIDGSLASLFPAIRARHTNRHAFQSRPIAPSTLAVLRDLAGEFSPFIEIVIAARDKALIADLVARGDLLQSNDNAFRRELSLWVRPNSSDQYDGIAGDAFGIPDPISGFGPWFVRNLNVGPLQAWHDRELTRGAAALISLKADDNRVHLIQAGEILERLLLTLTSLGLQYSFMNQPIEIKALRSSLASILTGDVPPQLMLRVGYGRPVQRPMPRRPLDSVVARNLLA
jgi:hypothetical protein